MITIKGARLLSDLRELATIGAFQSGVDRVAYSAEDVQARRWLVEKLELAGLDASMDPHGTVLGRDSRVKRSILVGSHTDTVPKGGWLDGALGVIYALEIARAVREARSSSPLGVDVVSFADEEGTYLPCFGSRSFCGSIARAEIERARSKDGTPLLSALNVIGGTGEPHRLDAKRYICYLEAHIEQGPRLEAGGHRVGVVRGIVGIRQFLIRATGVANHAGTTPIDLRCDAGAALIRFASWIANAFRQHGGPETVWNIGSMTFRPGAINVVPSEAELLFEFRDIELGVLDQLEDLLLSRAEAMNNEQSIMAVQLIARISPALMDSRLVDLIVDSARELGEMAPVMSSGAGHDAMVMTTKVPSAMLFVPSIGGISHSIAEDTSEEDLTFGCQVLADAVSRLLDNPSMLEW